MQEAFNKNIKGKSGGRRTVLGNVGKVKSSVLICSGIAAAGIVLGFLGSKCIKGNPKDEDEKTHLSAVV